MRVKSLHTINFGNNIEDGPPFRKVGFVINIKKRANQMK